MHRCFETYDLVVALLDALSELFDESEEGETNRKRALARMALTCKVFLHPALNLLWQRLTGLEPIVQFFPTQSQGDGIKLYTLPEDWTRIYFYTEKIQSLAINESPPAFDDALSREYAERSPLLFPHLREAKIRYWEHVCSTSALRLPRLRSLAIQNFQNASILISQNCANIQHLHVDFRRSRIFERGGASVLRFTLNTQALSASGLDLDNALNLECLEFDYRIPQSVIDKIGLFSRLRFLRIGSHIYMQFPVPTNRSLTNKVRLPSLRVIVIDGRSMGNLEALTHYLECPLEVMDLRIRAAQDQELASWLRLLKDRHRNTLKKLCIATNPALSINHDLVSSLSGFSLVELGLEGFLYPPRLDRVIALAECFPELEALTIIGDNSVVQYVGFDYFANLLLLCPKLKSLGLDIDFVLLPSPEAELPISSLRYLHVLQSSACDVRKTAQVLRKMLPKLERLDWLTAAEQIMDRIEDPSWMTVRDNLGVSGEKRAKEARRLKLVGSLVIPSH